LQILFNLFFYFQTGNVVSEVNSEVKKNAFYHEFSFDPVQQIGKFNLEILNNGSLEPAVDHLFPLEVIEHDVDDKCVPCKNSFSGRKRKPDVEMSNGKRRKSVGRHSSSASSSYGSSNEEQSHRTILESLQVQEGDLATANGISQLGGGINHPFSPEEVLVSDHSQIPGTSFETEMNSDEFKGFPPELFRELDRVVPIDLSDLSLFNLDTLGVIESVGDVLHHNIVSDGPTSTSRAPPTTTPSTSTSSVEPQLRILDRRRRERVRGPIQQGTVYKSSNSNTDPLLIFSVMVGFLVFLYEVLYSLFFPA
jgi:hypothetical protein